MDEMKQAVSRALQDLVASGKVQAPISSLELLGKIISAGSSSSTYASFRLTDLRRFEVCLEELSDYWEVGSLSVLRDDNGFSVMRVKLEITGSEKYTKKRKRHVDEDADSAEEEAAEASIDTVAQKASPATTLSNLSKEVQEIYALLQKGTARKRLLAEQVRANYMPRQSHSTLSVSISPPMLPLSPYVPT